MKARVMQIMSEVFGVAVESIGEDASPDTIGTWDSLRHMQLVLALEEELDVTFPDERIPELIRLDVILSVVEDLRGDQS